ncbi:MAG: hypothetical protein K4305_11285 [Chlorobium sp.]|uniref:glycoside hydrolase family 18 protein n=1 Tax=Chlorobium sp. TaxID=1095 RepID=UPI002F3E55F0
MRRGMRSILLLLAIPALAALAYHARSSCRSVADGRHDLRTNGIWIEHGWLGDDNWFDRNNVERSRFRNTESIRELAVLLATHGVRDVFPHLCPATSEGQIAPADSLQTERFLDGFSGFRVLPWVGGVLRKQCFPDSAEWRENFVSSSAALLQTHPRLAGIHLNIEPVSDGSESFLMLLDELRRAIPKGKIISVAAYPPHMGSRPFSKVHWNRLYYSEVAQRSDQIVPMMYDTSLRSPRLYRKLMSDWAVKVLDWSGKTEVLLGIPAYDDPGAEYHNVETENLPNALSGIDAGLESYRVLPENYAGVAIYCEWEMDSSEWLYLRTEFLKKQEACRSQ